MENELSSILNRVNELGCADRHCWISGPAVSRVHTNGRCHCLDSVTNIDERRKIREAFSYYHRALKILRDRDDEPAMEVGRNAPPADPVS